MGDVGTHNPWRDGGCVPDAPTNVSATAVGSGKLTVSWQAGRHSTTAAHLLPLL